MNYFNPSCMIPPVPFHTIYIRKWDQSSHIQERFVYSVVMSKKSKENGVTKDLHYRQSDYHLHHRLQFRDVVTYASTIREWAWKASGFNPHIVILFLTWKDPRCAIQATRPPVICISCTFHEFDLVILSKREITSSLSIIVIECQYVSFWFDKRSRGRRGRGRSALISLRWLLIRWLWCGCSISRRWRWCRCCTVVVVGACGCHGWWGGCWWGIPNHGDVLLFP